MQIVFRTDSSLEIGTGHIRRCLALAQAAQARGHLVRFVTRDLPGRLKDKVLGDHPVTMLPAPLGDWTPDAEDTGHANWAGVSWQQDASETSAALREESAATWIVLDHYAFDQRWQHVVCAGQSVAPRMMVWDDLADRPHECDILLDQNYGTRPDAYVGLVPGESRQLLGPAYAILRPEFASLRASSLARRATASGVRRVLISMGGIDLPDATSDLLEAFSVDPHGVQDITVVMGGTAPALERVRRLAAESPIPVQVVVDTPDMAQLMASADLAIGAVGGTTWERCALGLPSLTIVIADNQRAAARALARDGVTIALGDAGSERLSTRLAAALSELAMPERLQDMVRRTAAVTDGLGADRVLDAMEEVAYEA